MPEKQYMLFLLFKFYSEFFSAYLEISYRQQKLFVAGIFLAKLWP